MFYLPKDKQRFWAKVEKSDGCWLWRGTVDTNGYGRYNHAPAHQIAYVLSGGWLRAGLELDHLCRTPLCVRRDHLEAVTHRVNVLRGEAPSAQNARKTHCPAGHEYSGKNLRVRHGKRYCRACEQVPPVQRMRRHRSSGTWGLLPSGLLLFQLSLGLVGGKRVRRSFTGKTRLECMRKAVVVRRAFCR